jgi:hypothetical protein
MRFLRSGSIEVLDIGMQDTMQLLLLEDEKVIEALATHAAQKPFTDQRHGFCGYLWFGRCCSGLILPEQAKSLPMPPQERLRLDNEKRMLPCTRRPSEKDQDQTIRLCACWSFDLPTEDDELLPQEGVFHHKLGLASGKVSHRIQHERGIGRRGPVDEAVVERLKTPVCQALDKGNNRLHSIRFLY